MQITWEKFWSNLTADPWHIFFGFADVLLVILFIWQVFRILRGTKGVAFLNVLGALLLFQLAVTFLPMPFFNRLLGLVVPMLLVAFPVVFQPELRRALEQLGRRNFLSRILLGSHPEQARFISAVVQAAGAMAENRVGGLIVFERDQSLDEIAATGIRLDARISVELIRQIFAVRGPLHDGALIIKGQRIQAAACLLPLSDRSDLGTIGTRHRAGLGLAEVSDAVAIIVSEERGSLTLAVDGHLEQNLPPDELSLRLAELLLGNGRQQLLTDLRRNLHERKSGRTA